MGHIDLSELVASGIITSHFPLHNAEELVEVASRWARICFLWTWMQPLNDVHAYFGARTAFYFAWLGFQAKALAPLAVFGAVADAVGQSVKVKTEDEQDMNELSTIALAFCAAVAIIWASVYLKFWN